MLPVFQFFWIGLCALAMMWQTPLLLHHGRPSFWLMGFVFGATVFAYNYAAPGRRGRVAWMVGLPGAVCFWNLSAVQQIAVAVPAAVWWLYYDPRRPHRAGLRKFPVLKPAAIALAWAWVTVLLPLVPGEWAGAAAVFAGRAAFIFALALAYDLCDQAYDRRQEFVTLVLQIGPRNTFRLIDAALVLSAVCCCLNYVLKLYSLETVVALLFSLMLSRQIIRESTVIMAWGDWRKVVIDGLMMVQLGFVWVSKILPYI